jgi:hypothetical protein
VELLPKGQVEPQLSPLPILSATLRGRPASLFSNCRSRSHAPARTLALDGSMGNLEEQTFPDAVGVIARTDT